eukprot:gene6572-3224_t
MAADDPITFADITECVRAYRETAIAIVYRDGTVHMAPRPGQALNLQAGDMIAVVGDEMSFQGVLGHHTEPELVGSSVNSGAVDVWTASESPGGDGGGPGGPPTPSSTKRHAMMETVAKQLFFGASDPSASPAPSALNQLQASASSQKKRNNYESPYGVRYGIPVDSARRRASPAAVSYRMPDSNDSDSSEEEVDSTHPMNVDICMLDPSEERLIAILTQQQRVAKLEHIERVNTRSEAWMREEQLLAVALNEVSDSLRQKESLQAQSDARHASAQQHERDERLKELQRSHEKAAALQQQQVDKLQRQALEEKRAREAKAAEEARKHGELQRKLKADADAAEAKKKAELEAAQNWVTTLVQSQAQSQAQTPAEAKKKAELEAAQNKATALAQSQAQSQAQTPASASATAPKAINGAAPVKLNEKASAAAKCMRVAPGAAKHKASAAAKCMRVAPGAAKHEAAVRKNMAAIQATIDPLLADESLKKERRAIEKKMTTHVQQISATLDQVAKKCQDAYLLVASQHERARKNSALFVVAKKCQDVYQLVASQPEGAWRNFALFMFATKVSRQSGLILLNNKAAFPLATVVVKVSTQFPALMDIMLSIFHTELVVAVPMSFVSDPSILTPAQHHRLMGYQEMDDPDTGGRKFESTDDLCRRIEGMMLLYGAVVQVEEPNHPHGLGNGWQWLAWLLNAMPADRISAKALICFLRTAGYTMHAKYRGQFIKLLKCMYEDFLPELGKLSASDPDVLPLRTLLEHYLTSRQFEQEPEGRAMPRIDISSFCER